MASKIKKILVTGSNGTIGTRLCEVLRDLKYQVYGVDQKLSRWNKKTDEENISTDLRNRKNLLFKLPSSVDLIIHLAANARVHTSVLSPLLAKENFLTTFNVLEFARKKNIKKIIFASSREVYGNLKNKTFSEDLLSPDNCESPYAATKIAGEALMKAYKKCYDIDHVIFRFSNVYGMYDESDRLIPLLIKLCRYDKNIVIYGKKKKLDFTYIDDAIKGIVAGIEKFDSAKNETYNLASGKGEYLSEIAESIKKTMKSKSKISYKDNRAGEIMNYVANLAKAKKKLKFKPTTPLKKGLELTIDWYKKNLNY